MFAFLRTLLAIAAIVLVSGCAGTNFRRPEPQEVVVGQTPADRVVLLMGAPRMTGEVLTNGQKVKIMTYAYAAAGGEPHREGVTPARAMTYGVFDDVVVSQTFLSSFKQDATEFDDSKVSAIVKGKTTRSEVLAMLGRPHGEVVYPMLKEKGRKGVLYNYTQVRMILLSPKIYTKQLMVGFDASDVAEEVTYTAHGDK